MQKSHPGASALRPGLHIVPGSVRGRLFLTFGVLLAIIAAAIVAAVLLTREYRATADELRDRSEASNQLNGAIQAGAGSVIFTQFYLGTGSDALLTQAEDSLASAVENLNLALESERDLGDTQHVETLEQFLLEMESVVANYESAIALRQEGNSSAAAIAFAQSIPAIQKLADTIVPMLEEEEAEINGLADHANNLASYATYAWVIAGAFAAILAVGVTWLLARSILRPLAQLEKTAGALAAGDLEARASSSGPRELTALGEAFNSMTDALLDASKRRELAHELGQRVKELTALHRVSRLVQENDDLDEAIAGIAAIIPPAMQYSESAGGQVILDNQHTAEMNFAETDRVLRIEHRTESGRLLKIAACYHDPFPEADDGPFLKEERELLTSIAEILVSYLERQDATRLAQQSMERFSKAFHASPAAVSIWRIRDGTLIDTNATFLDSLGWSRDEAIHRTVDDLGVWKRSDRSADFRAQLASTGKVTATEFLLNKKDDQPLHAYGSAEMIELDGEECVLSIFYDVTARKQAESALRAAEQRWNSLVNHTSDLISLLDLSGTIIYESPSVSETLGYDQEELIGRSASDLFHPEDLPRISRDFQEQLARPDLTQTAEFRYRHKDGSYRILEAVSSTLWNEDGTASGVVTISRDITQRRRMEKEISFQAHLLEASGEAVIATNAEGLITYWNPAAERIYGWLEQEVLKRPIVEIVSDIEAGETSFELIMKAARKGATTGEWTIRRKDGQIIPIESTLTALRDGQGEITGIIGVSRDISDRKRAEDTIRHMAYHDSLTGLPNRLLLNDRFDVSLANARRNAERVCVISVDLDRFKVVNDTLGHGTGDELLKAVANRLKAHAREGDTVARVGGDEFVILLNGCTEIADGVEAAARLIKAFRKPFNLSDVECHTSLSVGVSFYPDNGETPQVLLKGADAAMYAAKEGGRDGFRAFGPELDTNKTNWLALEADLRHAISNGELDVVYQPQVSARDGDILGVEALARWNHPTRGKISPADFIRVAEESGLIERLGQYVLSRACTDAMTWASGGSVPIRLAVNVSLRQIERPDFVAKTKKLLKQTGFPPHMLELEITETTALTNVGLTRSIAQQLAEMGIRLALDDFGTGNTALRYLSDLPIHTLKIDQSFVQNLGDNPQNSEIVASVIALGHALSLDVVAEGVETPEQLDLLQVHDCDAYQGFLHSKPQPSEIIAEMLARFVSPVS